MSVQEKIFEGIPISAGPSWVLSYLKNEPFTTDHIKVVKNKTEASDKTLATMLNLSPRTITNYTKDVSKVKIDTKEHIVLLLSLIRHGVDVFGSAADFSRWLSMPNFYYGHKEPIEFLNTISGIQILDASLTGMEYGDNA